MRCRSLRSAMALTALAVVVAGCSVIAAEEDATPIEVTLLDDAIVLSRDSAPAGWVAFDVTNQGTEVHEIEVFVGDSTELPVKSGVADTSGMTMIDEVEDIPPGLTLTLEVDLAPGSYVVVCNLPGHYQMGMVTLLTVIP